MLFAASLLLSSCTTDAIDFYQPVEGNCSELHEVANYDIRRIASGDWYHQYASFGQEGVRCLTGHAVARGNINYIDLLLFDPKKNCYVIYSDDLTHHPDRPGMYTNKAGAVGFMIATDMLKYFYWVQCVESEGQTKVLVLFGTRQREGDEKSQRVYDKFSAILAKKKLLPKIDKINQTDCPPEYIVDDETKL